MGPYDMGDSKTVIQFAHDGDRIGREHVDGFVFIYRGSESSICMRDWYSERLDLFSFRAYLSTLFFNFTMAFF